MSKNVILGRVTIITAVYNAASTLEACIDSVLSQAYPNLEYILIDGGSTDGSLEIIVRYADRVRIVSEPDQGIYDAWNKGVLMATGEWIAFLGADDTFYPGAVALYMNAIHGKTADYISSFVKWVAPTGARLIGERWKWTKFRISMTTAHVGSMHHYSLFEKHGLYDLSYRIVGDYEFLLRANTNLNAFFVPAVTVSMKAGGASDSWGALLEARRAKIETGGRGKLLATLDLWIAGGKLALRRAVSWLWRRR